MDREFVSAYADVFRFPALPWPRPADQFAPWYCVEAFARDLAQTLASHRITVKLTELGDGTRLITAWRLDCPEKRHVISADYIWASPDEIRFVARAIVRSLASDPE